MIDPKEFRIDNVIGWRLPDGELIIGTVHSIEMDKIAIGEKKAMEDGSTGQGFMNIEGLEPIKIDLSWIRRMGFVLWDAWYYKPPERHHLVFRENKWVYRIPGNTIREVRYIHEVQNLYFSITGVEILIAP